MCIQRHLCVSKQSIFIHNYMRVCVYHKLLYKIQLE